MNATFSVVRAALIRFALVLFVCLAAGGSSCDQSILDSDGDGVVNSLDAFPFNAAEQFDTDGDGVGDNADDDDDGDGVPDLLDGPVITAQLRDKILVLNPDHDAFPSFTGNGVRDFLEFDALVKCRADPAGTDCATALGLVTGSAKAFIEIIAASPQAPRLFQFDPEARSDIFPVQAGQPLPLGITTSPGPFGTAVLGNLIGDVRDRGLLDTDTDNDGIPDRFEIDRDGDGVLDTFDAFPDDPSEGGDNDSDGLGDNADCNDDGPGGVSTNTGRCVPAVTVIRLDTNSDGLVDGVCPADQDGDGLADDLGVDTFGGSVGAEDTGADLVAASTGPFAATLALLPVTPGTVSIDAGGEETFTDDGAGNLIGGGGGSGTVNYATGDFSVTLGAPAAGTGNLIAAYDHGDGLIDTDRIDCVDLLAGNGVPGPDGISDAVATVGGLILLDRDADQSVDGACPADQDGDGFVDDLGADSDGDGFIDQFPGPGTVDLTTTCRDLLLDTAANGDGFSDPLDTTGGQVADFFCPPTIAICDLIPDALESDSDNDGCPDFRPPGDPTNIPNCPLTGDAFPFDSTETQDTDLDGVGDNADVCPTDSQDQCFPRGPADNFDCDADYDNDGTPNAVDPDIAAGVCDALVNSEDPDIDGDGVPDKIFTDTDGDSVPDLIETGPDRFPFDPTEFADNDLDGVGDNADSDDDNDGLPDALECQPAVMLALLRGELAFNAVTFDGGPCDADGTSDGVVLPRVTAEDLIDDPNGCFGPPGTVTLNTQRCTFTNPRFSDSDLDGLSDGAEWVLLKQFLAAQNPGECLATDEIFDLNCPLRPIEIFMPDPNNPLVLLSVKRTYPLIDPNTDADRPDGQIITALSDPQALDGFDPAPYTIGTEDKDSDLDGLLDSQERFYGTNPFLVDSDADGLSDLAEVALDLFDVRLSCSDPLLAFESTTSVVQIRPAPPPSCADCLPARIDTICRFNPCDPLGIEDTSPADGFIDWCPSVPVGTRTLNPNNPDVDGDGLLDGEEFNGFFLRNGVKVRTNPVLPDTDNEGAEAGFEVANPDCNEIGGGPAAPCLLGEPTTAIAFPDGEDNCPIIPNSDQRDSDFDGAGDYQTTPAVFPGGLFDVSFPPNGCDPGFVPLSAAGADFDGDGLDDNLEVSPQAPRAYATNPGDADTDNDGVSDASDNCPVHFNPPIIDVSCPVVGVACQVNADGDAYGAACDTNDGDSGQGRVDPDPGTDSDLDGLTDFEEMMGLRLGGFRTAIDNADSDGDGVLDSSDNCPCVANPAQSDLDGNGVGDLCEGSFGASCQ